jgi:hypothetical protein
MSGLRKVVALGCLSLFLTVPLAAQEAASAFDRWFVDRTMRVDYYHIGNSTDETVTLDRLYDQGPWAGSTENLLDTRNLGAFYVKVFDVATNQLIFSRGFDTIFREYQTTAPAAAGISRTFHESILMPRPKKKFQWMLERRDTSNHLTPVFSTVIDPNALTVIREALIPEVTTALHHEVGDPHRCVDLLLVADGYAAAEEEKFAADCRRMTEMLFRYEPYRSEKSVINVRSVFRASAESDVSKPHFGEFRSGSVGCSFYSLGSPRYLLTEDNRALRDVAAHAPYDALCILVNTPTYGGGGIYNLYATNAVDNQWAEYLFIHEMGHSLSGLADEYYSSSTAYDEETFYPPGLEPLEPNITRLIGEPLPKWHDLADAGEYPTPWGKADYDGADAAYQQEREEMNRRIAEAKRSGAAAEIIAGLEGQSERLSREAAERADAILRENPNFGKVGAFEGAGYCSSGVYRPELDCIMFTKGSKPFCRVCRAAIERTIRFHTGR